jgi:tetratricopeptide (TPR) repeat protein
VFQAEQTEDADERQKWLEKAVEFYTKSLRLPGETQFKYNYGLALGGVETQLGHLSQAITAYTKALQVNPRSANAWRVEEALARLYLQSGDLSQGLQHVNNAIALAPEDQRDRLKAFMEELNTQP